MKQEYCDFCVQPKKYEEFEEIDGSFFCSDCLEQLFHLGQTFVKPSTQQQAANNVGKYKENGELNE